jgi:hypothetical protein
MRAVREDHTRERGVLYFKKLTVVGLRDLAGILLGVLPAIYRHLNPSQS